jgi:TPR repeat protein
MSGNMGICPFCNSDRGGKTGEDVLEDIMKRVEANDPASIAILAKYYYHGIVGVQQDQAKAMELYARATELGLIKANCLLADIYHNAGDLKKAKFHWEAASMAGHEVSRNNLGILEAEYGKIDRAVKHWTIAASAGCYEAMNYLRLIFEQGHVSIDAINSTLVFYNNSCAEMRSKARDVFIQTMTNVTD